MRPSRFLVVMALAMLVVLVGACSAQTVSDVYDFNYTTGSNPLYNVLAQGRDGKLYGMTYSGGANGIGTAFSLTSAGTETVLANFGSFGTCGQYPVGGLILGTDGSFYGTTDYGESLFKMTSQGKCVLLHSFCAAGDGCEPWAAPIEATDGNLYGTTTDFNLGYGTAYKSTRTGTLTTIHRFSGTDGSQPEAPLIQAADGNFYGTAYAGGTYGCGTIFKMASSGTLLRTYSFPCGSGGANPAGPLVQAADGGFYGTTVNGGLYGLGTIFRLNQTGVASVIYSFGAVSLDGSLPYVGLVQATDGNLYGATSTGGAFGEGTLFQLSAGGLYTLLYSFENTVATEAVSPLATLVQHTNGKLYGVTEFGGIGSDGGEKNWGMVYSLDMGLGPFVAFVRPAGVVGSTAQILGQGFTGTTSVTFNGVRAATFTVLRDTFMTAVVPSGATTGKVVVTTPGGTLTSNVNFRIIQ